MTKTRHLYMIFIVHALSFYLLLLSSFVSDIIMCCLNIIICKGVRESVSVKQDLMDTNE